MQEPDPPPPAAVVSPEPITTPLPESASRLIRLYDRLDRMMKSFAVRGPLTTALILVYLGSLLAIEARRTGWLPASLAVYVSNSHFVAIGMAFYVLVLAEIVGLIFGLVDSVARSVG